MEEHAFKLIEITNNRLTLTNQAVTILQRTRGAVFPVAMTGPVLTGRSSLLNKIVGRRVFAQGSSTKPTTWGIYAYLKRATGIEAGSVSEMYLDTQGFDDSSGTGDEDLDSKILALMISISKVVMYNSFGALETKIFDRLSSVCRLLPKKLTNDPHLVLVQRDFSLKLTTKDCHALEPEQYLDYFVRNFKNKKTIERLNNLFPDDSHLSCYLFPNQEDNFRFSEQVNRVAFKVKATMINSVLSHKEKHACPTSCNFLSSIEAAVSLLNQNQPLTAIANLSEQGVQEKIRNLLTAYKSHVADSIKKEIRPRLPLAQEVLKLSLDNIFAQSKTAVKAWACLQSAAEAEMMQIDNKVAERLAEENGASIKQALEQKVKQLSSQLGENSEQNQKLCFRFKQNLQQFCHFVSERDIIWVDREICQQRIKICAQQQRTHEMRAFASQSRIKEHEQKQRNLNQVIAQLQTKYQKVMEQKQSCQKQIRSLNQQLAGLLLNLKQTKVNLEAVASQQLQNSLSSLQSIHEVSSLNRQQQRLALGEITNQMRQGLTYSKPAPTAPQRPNSQDEKVLEEVNKIAAFISGIKDKERGGAQCLDRQKVVLLESVNRSLKEKIEQMLATGTHAQIIQRRYQESLAKLEEKEKLMRKIISDKDEAILQLKNQMSTVLGLKAALEQEISLLRGHSSDKAKTSVVLQRVLKSMEKSLEEAQSELMSATTRHRQELSQLRAQCTLKQAELSRHVAGLVVKNQQLTATNMELQDRLRGCDARWKKTLDDKVREKDEEIEQLVVSLAQYAKDQQQNAEQYQRFSETVQRVIKQKDECIEGFRNQAQSKQALIQQLRSEQQQLQSRYQECLEKLRKAELQRQEMESKSVRGESLLSKKIKHIEHSNQKLKLELKEKEQTFQVMLGQLRHPLTVICANGEPRNEKYLRRIDKLEELALRELDEISSHGATRRERVSCAPAPRAKAAEYGSETKTRRESLVKFTGLSEVKNRHDILHSMSMSTGFKTVARRL